MEAVLVAAIGALGTIVAAWLSRSSSKRAREQDRNGHADAIARIAGVVASGASITTVALLVLFMMRTLPVRPASAKGLRGFSESAVVPLVEDMKKRDADAAGITGGAGPRELRDEEGTLWTVEQVLYVSRPETINAIVYPVGARTDFSTDASCTLQPLGRLKIRGFRAERKEALLEYAAPSAPPGCVNATLFFYPIDPQSSGTLSAWFRGET